MTTPISHPDTAGDKPVNPIGGSGRGSFCTPSWLTKLIGPVDFDPCANAHSAVQAKKRCFGLGDPSDDGLAVAGSVPKAWRVYVNPPFNAGEVLKWVNAYAHTDFMFMLRFDPSTIWFAELIKHTRYLWFPYRKRINFQPPPGVEASSNPFPHALYCASKPNDALLAHGYVLEVTDDLRAALLAGKVSAPDTSEGAATDANG